MKSTIPNKTELGEALHLALRSVYHFERSLIEKYQVGYQEICLLKLLQRHRALRVGQVAQALELPLFAATRLVQRLELRGLVEKSKDPGDGRAVLASLGPEGSRLLDRIEGEDYHQIGEGLRRLQPRQAEGFVFAARNLDGLLGIAERVGERTEPGRALRPYEAPEALEA